MARLSNSYTNPRESEITRQIKNPAHIEDEVLHDKMPDDDLLSHGETPHYHRRKAVSLLSSGWNQVVHTRYCRQTIRNAVPQRRTTNNVLN